MKSTSIVIGLSLGVATAIATALKANTPNLSTTFPTLPSTLSSSPSPTSSSTVSSTRSPTHSSTTSSTTSLIPLPTLDANQLKYARAVMKRAKDDNVGPQGCKAAIATCLVECKLRMCANRAVPASLQYPYDVIGSDSDSIGLFQQRASIYKNVKCDMDAGCSAGQFFDKMKKIKGWQTLDVGTLCQKVQQSKYPDRYAKRVAEAAEICKEAGL